MAKAYLKVNVAPGKEKIIRSALSEIKGIKEASITTGDQDIIALIEEEDFESILKLVLTKLRIIDGITRTDTSLILE
ncbi:MAG: Lrp/AsnC ligand binding domain-containing protein [Candidatus Omnitrophica bacterium]|nr:Lrp/AsnC ligand binding domain-containing protein [Candidatus Omnitrophota bacterium]